jgi:hypothetical protein
VRWSELDPVGNRAISYAGGEKSCPDSLDNRKPPDITCISSYGLRDRLVVCGFFIATQIASFEVVFPTVLALAAENQMKLLTTAPFSYLSVFRDCLSIQLDFL